MKLDSFLYSRLASELAVSFSQIIPEKTGYPLAELIARLIGRWQHANLGRAVRANQWVVSRMRMTAHQLDEACVSVFRFAGFVIYDFYHHLGRGREILERVEYTPRILQYLERSHNGKEPMLFVLPHMGNFDLVGRALALRGARFQVLSYPQPPSGYQLQNRIREAEGVDVTPMSLHAMRQAVERLRNGGIVITGMDRPLAESNYHPKFFGLPAALPVAYIRLAMKVDIPVIVGAAIRQPSGKYLVDASEPVSMRSYSNNKDEIEKNAESVLALAEKFILRAPQQWMMFYPVWPQTLKETP